MDKAITRILEGMIYIPLASMAIISVGIVIYITVVTFIKWRW